MSRLESEDAGRTAG